MTASYMDWAKTQQTGQSAGFNPMQAINNILPSETKYVNYTPAPVTGGYTSNFDSTPSQSFNWGNNGSVTASQPSSFLDQFLPAGNVAGGIPNMGSSGGVGGYQPSLFDKIVGYRDKDGAGNNGIGNLALNAGQGLMNAYLGMQMYGVAKDTLAHNKDQFNKNYAAQVSTTNARSQDMVNSRDISQAEKDRLNAERKIGG